MIASSTVSPAVECTSTIGGGEPVRHPVGEALHHDARLAGEVVGEGRSAARRCGRRGRPRSSPSSPSASSAAPSRSPTAQPPPETSTDRPLRRQTELAARLPLIARLVEARVGEAADAGDLACRGDPGDLLGRLRVGDQMKVDAGMRPVAERREVGDRRDDRDVDPSLGPQIAEDLRAAWIGGDHDVGRPLEHRSPDRPGGQPLGQPRREPACRRHVGDQPVGQVEEPVSPLGVKAGAVQDEPPHERVDQRQRVDDLDLGLRLLRGDPVARSPGRAGRGPPRWRRSG